jgi:hypothetical protein
MSRGASDIEKHGLLQPKTCTKVICNPKFDSDDQEIEVGPARLFVEVVDGNEASEPISVNYEQEAWVHHPIKHVGHSSICADEAVLIDGHHGVADDSTAGKAASKDEANDLSLLSYGRLVEVLSSQ